MILRWHLQTGNIANPGSSNEAHIQENFEVFDFELIGDEMQRLTALDKDQRFVVITGSKHRPYQRKSGYPGF